MKEQVRSKSMLGHSFNKNNSLLATPKSNEKKLFVYLTCLFIITWYLQLGLRVGILGAVRFEFLLGAFLSLSAIVKLLNDRNSTPIQGPIILFFAVLALSLIHI